MFVIGLLSNQVGSMSMTYSPSTPMDQWKMLYYNLILIQVATFLNTTDTKNLLGFNADLPYRISSSDVYKALSVDFMKSDCVERVEEVLKSIPVIIYNG